MIRRDVERRSVMLGLASAAAMLAPYTDDRGLSGKMFWEADKYKKAVAELERRGF